MTESRRKLATGRLCLELVATVHGRLSGTPTDDLLGGAQVASWLAAIGVDTAGPASDGDVSHYIEVREAIYRLVTSAATGDALGSSQQAADVALVNAWARDPAPVPQLRVGEQGLLSDTALPTPRQVLTIACRDAVDLLSTPEAARLHQCNGNHCGTVFLDTSRGGRRRWCSSDTCGNRARVAAHRDRHVSA
jgi:predicted RNA-binding Zn ribbon-like protein